MKRYIDPITNQLWDFTDDTDISKLSDVPEGLILLEGEALEAVLNPPLTQEQKEEKLKSDVKIAIQNMLDTKAKEYEYDDILSVASYKSPTPLENPLDEKFRLQGNAFYDWRSACWSTSIAYMTEVEDAIALAKEKGEAYTLPTVEDVLAKMPMLDL